MYERVWLLTGIDPRRELELYESLSKIAGSESCLYYDACPIPGFNLVVNIDGYSETYSRYRWMSIEAWSYRAIMASISDLIAVGARPIAVWASIGVLSEKEALDAVAGMRKAADILGIPVLKSDTNKSRVERWIDVASIGEVDRKPIGRKIEGDILGNAEKTSIVQIGYAGYGLIEWKLYNTMRDNPPDWLVWRSPSFNAWKILAKCGALASMDNSDGLAYTLQTLAFINSLDIYLDSILVDPRIYELIKEENVELKDSDFLSSWEDYNLVLITTKEQADCIMRECSILNVDCKIIGCGNRGAGRLFYRGKLVDYSQGWLWSDLL